MEIAAARQIIDTLAQGIHPVTGEVMPDDSPYLAPPVIRALFAVSQALDGSLPAVPRKRSLPMGDAKHRTQVHQRLLTAMDHNEAYADLLHAAGNYERAEVVRKTSAEIAHHHDLDRILKEFS